MFLKRNRTISLTNFTLVKINFLDNLNALSYPKIKTCQKLKFYFILFCLILLEIVCLSTSLSGSSLQLKISPAPVRLSNKHGSSENMSEKKFL